MAADFFIAHINIKIVTKLIHILIIRASFRLYIIPIRIAAYLLGRVSLDNIFIV
jgi:hypothetical protein